jgi:hypothetical protein
MNISLRTKESPRRIAGGFLLYRDTCQAELFLHWLRFHVRQIVDVNVAGEAARKLLVEGLFVRQTVTVGTLRYKAVLVLVAGHAGQGTVLAGVVRQLGEDLAMTGTTGTRGYILVEGDLQRPVNRMTLGAAGQCQTFGMGFVTVEAGRFETVRGVADGTGKLRVLARELYQLITGTAVAVETGIYQLGRHCDFPWCMGVGVASAAIGDLRTMWCFMAGGAFWHDCIIIPLARVVGVKLIVAILAGETVPPAVILEALVRIDMALFRSSRDRYGSDLFPLRRCKRNARERKCNHHT